MSDGSSRRTHKSQLPMGGAPAARDGRRLRA